MKKKGHEHLFGLQCTVCLKEHPEAHKEKKRASYKERKAKRKAA